ncbi:Glyoxalase-like domain protein [Pseudovibrio axinellae]|uniref:Glyoxalase-like domain protein n=1 Tax=Pseudovibrio axinellae TaxID=989403 RepID=A0A161X8Y3_9HYPH|nr:VOC family protein [Pseudovibrio axinellae]KZL06746.1 Glyoxalase-like domain protein [Pseudovibrio axinellae]SER62748.1 hypothetical protein SAMN05421798_11471 [Pseudovibrio axinellae]
MAHKDKTINYIEFPLNDPASTKQFYETIFGWTFQEWGPKYLSFSGAGIDGGFNGEDGTPVTSPGTLVVLFSNDLAAALTQVKAAGARITREIYSFPGGRRFHFCDPNGNELAIWAEATP